MQKKSSTFRNIVLVIFLGSVLSVIIAQNSDTDFRKASETNDRLIQQESGDGLIFNDKDAFIEANDDSKGVAKKQESGDHWLKIQNDLIATGWEVSRETDGTLILAHPEFMAIEKGVAIEKKSETNSLNDKWLKIQNKLQATGWKVDREQDGTLLLFPPLKSSVTRVSTPTKSIPDIKLSVQMQEQLKKTGWEVIKNSDNSVSLYPPEQSISTNPSPKQGSKLALGGLVLPVDNWQEAFDIANNWLDRQPLYNASIGKIRKILKIYVVSIVSKDAPHKLIQQIAIRSSDGAVIVLN